MTGRGYLSLTCPIIEKNIKIWSKGYMIRNACAFTKNQLLEFQNVSHINNPIILTMKVYSVLAVSFAARSSETHLTDVGMTLKNTR